MANQVTQKLVDRSVQDAVNQVRLLLAGKCSLAAACAALQLVDDDALAIISFAARAPIQRLRELRRMGGLAV